MPNPLKVTEEISAKLAEHFNVNSEKVNATFEFISADGFIFLCNNSRVSEGEDAITDMHKMFNALGLERHKVISGGIYRLHAVVKHGEPVDMEVKFFPDLV